MKSIEWSYCQYKFNSNCSFINSLFVGAVAEWLERQTADAEVPGSSPHHGMEELSRSSFNHCFTPPRWNGYLALGNLSDGAGSSS